MMPPRAGIVYTHNEGGVAGCVREEERPPTPAAISKWRRSGTSLPAAQEVDPKMSFGSGGVKASDHVADIWRQVCSTENTDSRQTPDKVADKVRAPFKPRRNFLRSAVWLRSCWPYFCDPGIRHGPRHVRVKAFHCFDTTVVPHWY